MSNYYRTPQRPEDTVRFRDSLLAQALTGTGRWLLLAVAAFVVALVAVIIVRVAS